MGCFLACFGYSKKRKNRRKSISGSRKIILSQDQGHGSYVPLQPEVTSKFNITKNPTSSYPEFRDKQKDHLSSKIKKKVRFNLNVKTYEPIPNDETADYFSESCEKEKWNRSEEETKISTVSLINCEGNSIGPGIVSYHSNYRYQNYSDSYDEEDEIRLEESDPDDDEFSDTDEEDGCDSNDEEDDGWKTSKFEFIEQFYSQNKGSNEEKVGNAELPVEKSNNLVPLHALPVRELKKFEGNNSARDRSMYVHSVLNPVENLTQWKAIKARSKPPLKRQKENITSSQEQQRPLYLKPSFNPLLSGSRSNLDNSKPLMQEMAVDASLTNSLILLNNKRLNSPSTRKGETLYVSPSRRFDDLHDLCVQQSCWKHTE